MPRLVAQIFEDGAEAPSRAMQPSAHRHGQTTEDFCDLGRRQAFPLGQQQDFAVASTEAVQRLVHERFGSGLHRRLLDRGLQLQPLLEVGATAARTSLVGDHSSRRGVQPYPRRVAIGQLLEAAPGDEEDVGGSVLRVAGRASPPGAVRDDVLAMSGEERVEAPPPFRVCPLHHPVRVRQTLVRFEAPVGSLASTIGESMASGTDNGSTPLMLIHGAWLSARSWENFADYFSKSGYAVSAPEWPRKEGDVEELREETEELRGLGIVEILDHYEQQIRALDEPQVLIGHSFGGLFVEVLLDRGLGRAGVALSPAPPKGILVLPFSSLKAAAPALAHPSKYNGVVTLSLEEFTYGFVNTFPPEEAGAAYERYAVPETGHIFYEAGFANFHFNPPTEVHFKKADRAPLLIVGATKDNTVPASLAHKQYKKYERGPAATDYIEFEDQPHLLMAADGWEEVAGAIDNWLDGVLATDKPTTEEA
jgi:alpha-beta hydrolase superfamily lysophospholipase